MGGEDLLIYLPAIQPLYGTVGVHQVPPPSDGSPPSKGTQVRDILRRSTPVSPRQRSCILSNSDSEHSVLSLSPEFGNQVTQAANLV